MELAQRCYRNEVARHPTMAIRLRPVDRERVESLRRDFRERFGLNLSRAGAIRTALRHGDDVERTDAD